MEIWIKLFIVPNQHIEYIPCNSNTHNIEINSTAYSSPLNQPQQLAIAEANAEANSIFLGKKIAEAVYAQWKIFFYNFER